VHRVIVRLLKGFLNIGFARRVFLGLRICHNTISQAATALGKGDQALDDQEPRHSRHVEKDPASGPVYALHQRRTKPCWILAIVNCLCCLQSCVLAQIVNFVEPVVGYERQVVDDEDSELGTGFESTLEYP